MWIRGKGKVENVQEEEIIRDQFRLMVKYIVTLCVCHC